MRPLKDLERSIGRARTGSIRPAPAPGGASRLLRPPSGTEAGHHRERQRAIVHFRNLRQFESSPRNAVTLDKGTITMNSGWPNKQGLYDPQHEHDSCGGGFVVDLKGRKSHRLVCDGLKA